MANSAPPVIPDLHYALIRKSVQFAAHLGYRLQIKGEENLTDRLDEIRDGAIFAGNHESVIDAFLMGLVVPPDLTDKRIFFLGKQSALWRNKFWGRMMDYFGVIPVKRRGNQEVIKRGIEVLQSNNALGIFPEGHIRYSRKDLEGRVGVARFAFETDSPVVPVGIIGTDGLLPYGGNWPRPGKKVTIHVGKPIFLHMYDKQDMYNPYALRAATDLIMHEIRVLSQGYGILPEEAHSLRCMDGINQVITPPKWLLNKKRLVDEWSKRKKRTNIVDSFQEWLASVPPPKRQSITRSGYEKVPQPRTPSGDVSKDFLRWLDDQL